MGKTHAVIIPVWSLALAVSAGPKRLSPYDVNKSRIIIDTFEGCPGLLFVLRRLREILFVQVYGRREKITLREGRVVSVGDVRYRSSRLPNSESYLLLGGAPDRRQRQHREQRRR